jgi:hypothetical protein
MECRYRPRASVIAQYLYMGLSRRSQSNKRSFEGVVIDAGCMI